MNVVYDWPPNVAQIEKYVPDFRMKKNILSTYGDTIYNPHNIALSDDVIKHEEEHARQHANYPGGAEAFTLRCLSDKEFYLQSELEAYQVQYLYLCKKEKATKNQKKQIAQRMAYRLRNPIYGFAITQLEAVERISGVWRSSPEQSPLLIAPDTMADEEKKQEDPTQGPAQESEATPTAPAESEEGKESDTATDPA